MNSTTSCRRSNRKLAQTPPHPDPSEEEKLLPDKWLLSSQVLIRLHNIPRKRLFTPNEDPDDPCPIPLKFLDIMRRSDTSNTSLAESSIEDFWTDRIEAKRDLTDEWAGRTAFSLNMPPLQPGYEWQNGRPTCVQGSSKRPPSVWVEMWRRMSDLRKLDAIAALEKEKVARDKQRM